MVDFPEKEFEAWDKKKFIDTLSGRVWKLMPEHKVGESGYGFLAAHWGFEQGYEKALRDNNIIHGADAERFYAELRKPPSKAALKTIGDAKKIELPLTDKEQQAQDDFRKLEVI